MYQKCQIDTYIQQQATTTAATTTIVKEAIETRLFGGKTSEIVREVKAGCPHCFFVEMFKVFPSPGKGYGLQSTKNVNPGGMILNESPVAFVVTNKQREKRCASCLGPPPAAAEDGSQLRKCSRCKFVYYCGITCQKKDWRLHKQECKRITNVHPKRPPDICLLASRYLSQLTQEKNDVSKANKLERIHYYRDLVMKNEIPIDDKRKEMLVTFTIVLQSFIDSNSLETLGILSQDLLGFLCWLTCNCFNIMDEEMASVGKLLINTALNKIYIG